MPDFQMCGDLACPSAPLCRRSPSSGTQPKARWQAWGNSHREEGAKACNMLGPYDDEAEKKLIAEGLL